MEAEEGHEPDLRRAREELVSELRAIRAENAALRRSEALLRAVIEGIGEPVYAKDDRGRYLVVNSAAVRRMGRAADEIIGREDPQVLATDIARRIGEAGRRVMAEGQAVTFEDEATWAGLTRTYLTTEAPLTDDRGTIIGIIGISRDVTEVRRAGEGRYAGAISQAQDATEREQAGASPARDALLLANVRDSVIVTDPEGIVTYWNEGSTRLFGWRAEEMQGRPLTDRVPEPARPAMLAEVRAIAEGKEFSGEWEDYRKDGSRVWIDARVTRITDASGRPIGLMGVAHDITERKRAEEALRASERHFRAVFEGALDAMILVDNQGRFVDVNPAGCDLFGLPCDDRLGKSVTEFAEPGFDLERARAEYRRGIHRGSFRLVRPDGAVRETEYTAAAEVLPGRHLSVLRDVTERKRTEEALREREAVLRSFYDGAPMMMGVIEAVGRELVFVSVNAATAAFFDREAESLQGLPVRELGDPDFERCRLTWLGRVGEARLTGRPVRFEYDHLRSGEPRRLSAIVCPIAAGRAARPRLSFIVEDVTERRRAEAELVEWKARYEAAVQATGQVLYDWDTTTNEVVYGGNCAAILGYAPEELSGDLTRMLDLVHPEDRAAVAAAIDLVRSTGEPCCLEYRIRRGDGAYIVIRCDGYFTRLGVGPSTRLIGFLADVTDRQRAEEARRASDRRFRRVLENSRDVIYQLNLAGRTYDYLSPSVRDVLGRTPEELAAGGLSLALSSIHPEDRERRENLLARLMMPRSEAEFEPAHEYRVRVPGKGWRWMSDSGTPIRDQGGAPWRWSAPSGM